MQRQIGSETTPSIQIASQRPFDVVRSGGQHLDWLTGLEMKRTYVTGVRPASYDGEKIKKTKDSRTDQLVFRKQSSELPVSDVGGSLEAPSVQPTATLPACSSQIKLDTSNSDVTDNEVMLASATSLSTEQHKPESHPEQVQAALSETSDVLQLDTTKVQEQQLVADSSSVLADKHQDLRKTEDHQTSPVEAHAVSLDDTWRQSKVSGLKQTSTTDVLVLETAWKSSQTITSSQSMNSAVAPQRTETIKPETAEDNLPVMAGMSSASREGNGPDVIHVQKEYSCTKETNIAVTLKGTEVEDEDKDESDWERKRRQRNEERKQREEAARRKEQEELEKLQAEEVSTRGHLWRVIYVSFVCIGAARAGES